MTIHQHQDSEYYLCNANVLAQGSEQILGKYKYRASVSDVLFHPTL